MSYAANQYAREIDRLTCRKCEGEQYIAPRRATPEQIHSGRWDSSGSYLVCPRCGGTGVEPERRPQGDDE